MDDNYKINKCGCYVLKMNPERYALFKSNYHWGEIFREPVASFDHKRNIPLFCFVADKNGVIKHIAKAKRGRSGGTDQRIITLEKISALNTPISPERILNALPKNIKRFAIKCFDKGGIISPKTSVEVIDAVLKHYPETNDLLMKYGSEYRARLNALSSNEKSALASQKEAISAAMAISNINREPLQEWTLGDDEKPKSFLDGLGECHVLEDHMLSTDLNHVPGYKHVSTVQHGAVMFEGQMGQRLTVVLANRHALEKTTGTDLIYYNEKFKSFVMVQYKVMEKEAEDTVFRIPNKQLSEELSRMEDLLKVLKACPKDSHQDSFRLNENPFYLKFCPRLQFLPNDKSLSKGMYVSLDYWSILEKSKEILGPKGGKALKYENVGRYLDNTDFITLVSGAWVGTTVSQSAYLEPLIKEALKTNKAVLIAVNAPR